MINILIMKILAHRGFWRNEEEQNTIVAFERAIKNGFGIETDIRDFNGDIYILHDVSIEVPQMRLEELLEMLDDETFLALNVKSCGLHFRLKKLLSRYNVPNYFLFDHAIPDLKVQVEAGLKCYQRFSKYEPYIDILSCPGVWFDDLWNNLNFSLLKDLPKTCQKFAIVSPELHGSEVDQNFLENLRLIEEDYEVELIICTDKPDFYESNFI